MKCILMIISYVPLFTQINELWAFKAPENRRSIFPWTWLNLNYLRIKRNRKRTVFDWEETSKKDGPKSAQYRVRGWSSFGTVRKKKQKKTKVLTSITPLQSPSNPSKVHFRRTLPYSPTIGCTHEKFQHLISQ